MTRFISKNYHGIFLQTERKLTPPNFIQKSLTIKNNALMLCRRKNNSKTKKTVNFDFTIYLNFDFALKKLKFYAN